jgi:predicted RNA methylase
MSSPIAKELIEKTSSSIVADNLSFDQIVNGINEIHGYFKEITDISGFDSKVENLAAVTTSKGKALGLNHAAQCLLDYNRTSKFIKAIVYAIGEKQRKHPDEVIHIFYAGCGPYATLLTLIAPLFKSSEIQFELLEINATSIQMAKKLIDSLELNDYVSNFHLEDAVTFKVPRPERFHILISETLDALLYRECYVPILHNLVPQFQPSITVIPENVIIDLSLLTHSSTDPNHKEQKLGTVFNVREILNSHDKKEPLPKQFPRSSVNLSELNMKLYSHVLLDTKVQVANDIWIFRNESSLTIPLQMELAQPFEFTTIQFDYHLEPEIELKCSVA